MLVVWNVGRLLFAWNGLGGAGSRATHGRQIDRSVLSAIAAWYADVPGGEWLLIKAPLSRCNLTWNLSDLARRSLATAKTAQIATRMNSVRREKANKRRLGAGGMGHCTRRRWSFVASPKPAKQIDRNADYRDLPQQVPDSPLLLLLGSGKNSRADGYARDPGEDGPSTGPHQSLA